MGYDCFMEDQKPANSRNFRETLSRCWNSPNPTPNNYRMDKRGFGEAAQARAAPALRQQVLKQPRFPWGHPPTCPSQHPGFRSPLVDFLACNHAQAFPWFSMKSHMLGREWFKPTAFSNLSHHSLLP